MLVLAFPHITLMQGLCKDTEALELLELSLKNKGALHTVAEQVRIMQNILALC